MRETTRLVPLVLLTLFILIVSGCQSEDKEQSGASNPSTQLPKESVETGSVEEVIATVGDTSITRKQLLDRLLTEYGQQTLRALMLTAVVEQEAKSLQLTVTDDELMQELANMSHGYESEDEFYAVMQEQLGMEPSDVREDARIRLLLEKIATRDIEVLDVEIDEYIADHREQFETRYRYLLAQIVLDDETIADQVLSQLKGGADFGAMAERYSLDEFSAEDGGSLGWIDDLDPFVDRAILRTVSSMNVGEIRGPIDTGLGYVIIVLMGRGVIDPKPIEQARQEVRYTLALGKVDSMQGVEQALLDKYKAHVIAEDAALQH
ncbi:MAG: peptidylprolyl isomerase [Candidatus Cohnella colombiensis]|uniref:peptidylprolyl isomerase n=1 Tax=Candidatus Cohnella colombiensis TaxID=3121368 RepID=A0AA95EWL0_9BACL|nr:MAG: peptidylprolyl isomerase [Cohnella sp.]